MSDPVCRFTLPAPPSTNNLFHNRRGFQGGLGRGRTALYKEWLDVGGWEMKLQGFPMLPGPVRVVGFVRVLIEAPLHRRRDLDNALKPLLDLLVKMRVIADDNLIDDLRIVRAGVGDKVTVSIWRMGEGGA